MKIRKPVAIQPSTVRRCLVRSRATSPTTRTMLTTGPTSSKVVGNSAARDVEEVEPPEAMFAATEAIGNPCAACQMRFGEPSARAMSAATHGREPASRRRGPTTSTPSRQLSSSGATRILISIAMPASTPTPIHGAQRCGSARIARTSSHNAAAVVTMSNVVVSNKCPTASVRADIATASAAAT